MDIDVLDVESLVALESVWVFMNGMVVVVLADERGGASDVVWV